MKIEADSVEAFTFSRIRTNLPRFSLGYEGTDNMFYFFYKILIFRFNNEEDYIIPSARVKGLNFFHETVTSHNLETEATILLTSFSCFIAL